MPQDHIGTVYKVYTNTIHYTVYIKKDQFDKAI